jgi:hypothetical protein
MPRKKLIDDVLQKLCSGELSTIQGCLEGLQDPGVIDALLRGLRYSKYGRFRLKNKRYDGIESPRAIAVGVVLHASPEHARVRALRDVVRTFRWHVDLGSPWPLDMGRIVARFPRMQRLELHGVRLLNIAALKALPELTEIHLGACEVPEGLSSLSVCPALQKLFVKQMALRALAVPGQVHTLVLEDITELPNLSCSVPPLALETLRLIRCPSLTTLSGLGALPRLRKVWVNDLSSLAGMGVSGPCASVTELSLVSCPELTFSGGFPEAPQLQSLLLMHLSGLQSLALAHVGAASSARQAMCCATRMGDL